MQPPTIIAAPANVYSETVSSKISQPKTAARLDGELALVEHALKKVGVPRPISFAWTGNGFGPQGLYKCQLINARFELIHILGTC